MMFLLNFPHKYSNFRDFNYFKSYSTLKIARDNHPKKTWSHLSYDIPHSNFVINKFSNDEFIIKFLSSLRQDINYVLLFVIVTDQAELKIAPNKAIHDINYLTPKNFISELVNNSITSIVEEYQLTGILKITFRYREEVLPTPVKFIKPPKHIKKSSLHLSRIENSNFKDLYAPFSFHEKNFGILLTILPF